MKPPHVLLLPAWYPSADSPRNGVFVQEQALALKEVGIKVGVIYPHLRSLRHFNCSALQNYHYQTIIKEEKEIPTARNEGWGIPRLYARQMSFAALLLFKQYCKHFGKPDVIHAHTTLYAGVAAQNIAHRYDLPLVITEHWTGYNEGLASPSEQALTATTLRKADAVFAVSRSLKQTLAVKVGFDSAEVLPNLLDTRFFTLHKRPRPNDGIRVLCVALFAAFKRIDVLIEAIGQLLQRGIEVELELGGDGPERERLKALVDSLGIGEKVKFLGLLSKTQVREAMHRADMFVLSSEVETFGVVLIEAMATGLPVIATRCGGPEDFVTPEVGRLVPVGDSQALASAIEDVGKTLEQFNPTQIRNHVEERFSAPLVAQRLIDRYKEILREAV